MRRAVLIGFLLTSVAHVRSTRAQDFVKYDDPSIVLVGVTVIDGTGSLPKRIRSCSSTRGGSPPLRHWTRSTSRRRPCSSLVSDPAAIRNVEIVFKEGIGYDPERLIENLKGRIGDPLY